MSVVEQQIISDGYTTLVVGLESGNIVCEFTVELYYPAKHAIEGFARSVLPDIWEFNSHEENRREFEEWKKQQDKWNEKHEVWEQFPILRAFSRNTNFAESPV